MNSRVLGTKIKAIRLSLGLNMEDFGKLFTPTAAKGTVSNWESGKYSPNNERIKKIAELGKITILELMGTTKFDWSELDKTLDLEAIQREVEELENLDKDSKEYKLGMELANVYNKIAIMELNYSLNDLLDDQVTVTLDNRELSSQERKALHTFIEMLRELRN